MRRFIWMVALVTSVFVARGAEAQDSWVQIEAFGTLGEAQERAQAYAGAFPNVGGFKLGGGWYGIALGPFTPEEAQRQLALLRSERLIPSDSYLTDTSRFSGQFWPVGANIGDIATATSDSVAILTAPEAEPAEAEPAPLDVTASEETPAEARAAEALLGREEREDLQRAMQFFGTYPGKIDGSFGPGTRAAMQAWQDQNGYETTGVLSTLQRRVLTEAWQGERAALGLTPVLEDEAGIQIDLPLGLVEFDRYEPPFVRYKSKDGSGYEVLLISRQGGAKTLVALYDRLQTLEIMPLIGERSLGAASFTINGSNDRISALATATMSGGLVKGYVVSWPKGDATRAARVLDAMKSSFAPQGKSALDENLGLASQTATADLVSGLEIRRPVISRSGVFIDTSGSVLTTVEVLDQCTRLTIDGLYPADLTLRDDTLGFAVITPQTPLAPPAVAEVQTALPRANAAVAVAGYSYEDLLDAPVVSFGSFAEGRGLKGEANLARLAITTLPGDAGGAVLDGSGAMLGLLLPQTLQDGRELPQGVGFALQSGALSAKLGAAGITMQPSSRTGALAAEDLGAVARSITALVSCWQ
ncbi:MAG: peptidoglycan-binding protein [Albidovulum sp.]